MSLASSTEGLQCQGNASRKISVRDGAFQGRELRVCSMPRYLPAQGAEMAVGLCQG